MCHFQNGVLHFCTIKTGEVIKQFVNFSPFYLVFAKMALMTIYIELPIMKVSLLWNYSALFLLSFPRIILMYWFTTPSSCIRNDYEAYVCIFIYCSFFSPFSSHHAGFYYTTCILSQINELNELNELSTLIQALLIFSSSGYSTFKVVRVGVGKYHQYEALLKVETYLLLVLECITEIFF